MCIRDSAIAIEVLSASTRDRDLGPKRLMYQEQSVPYYLILDPETQQLTAFMLGDNGIYAEMEIADSIALNICDGCDLKVPVDRLFD